MGCCNSTVLSAPIDDVWPVLRDFHDMSWASMIESLEKVGDTGGTEAGAKRILNGAFEKTLIELDDEGHTVRYSIDNGPGGVSPDHVQGFVGVLQAYPVTDQSGTFVLWTSSWASGGEETQAFCDPIYQSFLTDLKAKFA